MKIIAEISSNHVNDINLAKESILAASEAGADMVKIQAFTANELTLDSKNEIFRARSPLWKDKYLYELYKENEPSKEFILELFEFAKKNKIILFSTVTGEESFEWVKEINPIFKLASMDINHFPLIKLISKTKKPLMLSSGVATIKNIEQSISFAKENGIKDITLFKCVSNYPTKISEVNLANIPYLKEKFDVKVGLSDHTKSLLVPAFAVGYGAIVVEKHFILDKSIDSIDKEFSLDFKEFSQMVSYIKEALEAKGEYGYVNSSANRVRSIFVTKDLKKGEVLTTKNIAILRPSGGEDPIFYQECLGKSVIKDIKKGEPFSKKYIKD